MQPNMTDSARQKLRLQARAQIESIHDAVEDMRKSLMDEDTRGYMRNQLESAMKIEMRQTWKECVKITGRSFPILPRDICCTHTKLIQAPSNSNRPWFFPEPAGHRGPSHP